MTAPGGSPEQAFTVAEFNELVKAILEGSFDALWIRGEVTNFKAHGNGHWYFTLRDKTAQLSCVVWARDVKRLPAAPDEGMQVMARGRLSVYPARGQMQFMITSLEAEGEGLWRKQFEQTRAALEKDGLLDPSRKRAIPLFPRTVAVVTSADGAALHDVVSVIQRRNPLVNVVVVPAAVQGETAPDSLVAAIERVGRWGGADVVIVGRGGGSREDLWAFNDERVARAIAACPVPTISAVGHEVDFSIADLVADLRAATPSAAAEAAVPVLAELLQAVRSLGSTVRGATVRRVRDASVVLRQRARDLSVRARRATELRRARVQNASGRLEALSPLGTLARGYAVAKGADGRALGRAAAFTPGMPFDLQLHDGLVRAEARDVQPSVVSPNSR
ncbi:MAG: exodeoxyribonuclease VII large subunit [Gemmatimonadetes bacterium]|nr:exodeoxyribonuclease VII large subunit [Gemmatimonadota bacterium]